MRLTIEDMIRYAAMDYHYAVGLEKHIADGGSASDKNISDMIAAVKWLSTKIKEIYEDDNE